MRDAIRETYKTKAQKVYLPLASHIRQLHDVCQVHKNMCPTSAVRHTMQGGVLWKIDVPSRSISSVIATSNALVWFSHNRIGSEN